MIRLNDHFRICTILLIIFLPLCTTYSQDQPSPLERLKSLNLDTMRIGRVTAYSAPDDSARAEEMANLVENAATYFERELGFSFKINLAVLSADDWFSDIPGMPYAIPYGSVLTVLFLCPHL